MFKPINTHNKKPKMIFFEHMNEDTKNNELNREKERLNEEERENANGYSIDGKEKLEKQE